jgi:hypothetical protein
MKSLLLVVLGLLLIGSVASANEITCDPATVGTPVNVNIDRMAITQNLQSTLNSGCYSCGNVIYSYVTEEWAMRRFSIYWDNNIQDPFQVSSVQWGIRRFAATDSTTGDTLSWNPLDPPYVVQVELYKLSGDSLLTMGALGTPYATAPFTVTPEMHPRGASVGTAVETFFGPNCEAFYVDPAIYDLVVAIHSPETYTMNTCYRFALSASNYLPGETAPSYFVFPDCGVTEPSTPTELGATPPSSMLWMVVNGDLCTPPPTTGACCVVATGACTITTAVGCLAPGIYLGDNIPCNTQTCGSTPVERKSWGQVKSLYR